MTASSAQTPARHFRAAHAISYLMFGMVAVRELSGATSVNRLTTALLLSTMLLLLLVRSFIFRRRPALRLPYFMAQTLLIQTLGLLPPYQDVWGLLYVCITVQAHDALPIRTALAWAVLSAASLLLTMMVTMGAAAGLGFGLTYLAASLLIVSWDAYSEQAVAGRARSQALLCELQAAHRRLQEYAGQIEEHAVQRERDHLAHELHDSVSQTLFSINLTAESARLLLDRDPAAAAEQISRLQSLTAGALKQMRDLIAQWRPG